MEMAGGPKPPESPSLPFQGGGVEETKSADAAGAGGSGKDTAVDSSQEAWEAFNRHMDKQDKAVAAAAATAAAAAEMKAGEKGADSGTARGDLPPAMVEVLKVSLSLLKRLASRTLTSVGGPFSTSMPLWPSGHPQVCARAHVYVLLLVCIEWKTVIFLRPLCAPFIKCAGRCVAGSY